MAGKVISPDTRAAMKKIVTPAAAALVAGSVALPLAGFTTAGVVKGSLAAGAHSAIGNVAAGSGFASLMSLGAKGMALKAGAAGGALVALRSKL